MTTSKLTPEEQAKVRKALTKSLKEFKDFHKLNYSQNLLNLIYVNELFKNGHCYLATAKTTTDFRFGQVRVHINTMSPFHNQIDDLPRFFEQNGFDVVVTDNFLQLEYK